MNSPLSLRRMATAALGLSLVFASGCYAADQVSTSDGISRIDLVLDASGSMNTMLPEGRSRFDAARAAVADMVDKLPATTAIALRVYGHQSTPDKKNCEDTELVSSFSAAPERAAEIRRKIADLKALGYTPISLSLQRAAEDFASQPEGKRTIILVSDGHETCKADPCAVAQALAKANVSLVVHTIGFGADDAARRQLQCIASVARGSYFDANSMTELAGKLGEAAALAPAPIKADSPPPPKAVPQVGILKVQNFERTKTLRRRSQTAARALNFLPASTAFNSSMAFGPALKSKPGKPRKSPQLI
jgi:Ca-activated chloride channel homolog